MVFFDDDSVENNELNYIEEADVLDINSDDWMTALPPAYRDTLRDEYKKWYLSKKDTKITENEVKSLILKDLSFLCKMTVQEYTLYRKWIEIKSKYPALDAENVSHSFFDSNIGNGYTELLSIKNNIWIPDEVSDYMKLEPNVVSCDGNAELTRIWNTLRVFTSTQVNNSNIGRNLYFIVEDKVTHKYLGIINVSSDFMDLTARDKYIGWSREQKTSKRMINHTAIGSTIIPMQPLGYNYLGGKLIALLTISDVIENAWNNKYDVKTMPSKLVGMTTTSLYSSFSQYNNLVYWNKRGHSAGSVKFEVSKETHNKIKQYLQREYPLKYWEWYIATEPQGMPLKRDFKQRSLAFIYKKFNIDNSYFETNHERGIYFCSFYENMKEYLKMEITESELIRRKNFDNSIGNLSEIWKNKYASKRVKSFIDNSREFDLDILFYDDLIDLTWQQTKDKYLKSVGR